ncbi:MAG: transcription antitermination factor NusB [bacterium]|nr:MAG: transcription antitermination factor NusB [bacterium]
MGVRRRGRETALKVLYSMDINPCSVEVALEQVLQCGQVPQDARDFALKLLEGTTQRLDEIDGLIQHASHKWELGRMAAVDRNVLRLAVYELKGGSQTPVRVVLDEAIELAKKFGGEESGTFVNGVLDRIRLDLGLEP